MNDAGENEAGENTKRPVPLWRALLLQLWPVLAGVATGFGFRFIFSGSANRALDVMMVSFVLLVPVAIGAVTVYLAERIARRNWNYYFFQAALANALFVISTFLVFIEGLICTILAVPLFAVVGGIAGLLTGLVCRKTMRSRSTVLSVAVLPLMFGSVEHLIPLPQTIDTVESALEIDAAPAQVWAAVTNAENVAPAEMDSAWMYRIGVPLPLSATTAMQDGEVIRQIRMGKGIAFDQIAEIWEPERRVRYRYRFTADSFPPRALDDHVLIGGAYFDLIDTEYRLIPTDNGTRLETRISYRVSTHFNWYARPVAWLLVRNFEETALRFYASRVTRGSQLPVR